MHEKSNGSSGVSRLTPYAKPCERCGLWLAGGDIVWIESLPFCENCAEAAAPRRRRRQLQARKRRPAHFDVEGHSPVFKSKVSWRIEVSASGVRAKRRNDGRELSIRWETLLAAAMFYGCDSQRGERGAL